VQPERVSSSLPSYSFSSPLIPFLLVVDLNLPEDPSIPPFLQHLPTRSPLQSTIYLQSYKALFLAFLPEFIDERLRERAVGCSSVGGLDLASGHGREKGAGLILFPLNSMLSLDV
jgi:hypothetical protein